MHFFLNFFFFLIFMKLYLFKIGVSGKFFFTTINISTKYKIQKNNTLSPNSKHRLKMSCADKLFITILNSLNKIGVSLFSALTHSVLLPIIFFPQFCAAVWKKLHTQQNKNSLLSDRQRGQKHYIPSSLLRVGIITYN